MEDRIVQTTCGKFLANGKLVEGRENAEIINSTWNAHQAILAWRETASDADNDAVNFVILNA